MIYFTDVIYKLYPQVVRTVGDEAFDADGNLVAYDKDAVQAYVDAHAYKVQRANEYPSLADQLDMIYHDRINNTDTWMEAIQAVKNKYPKS